MSKPLASVVGTLVYKKDVDDHRGRRRIGLESQLRQTKERRGNGLLRLLANKPNKGPCEEAIRRHPRERGCRAMNSTPTQSYSAQRGTPLNSKIGQIRVGLCRMTTIAAMAEHVALYAGSFDPPTLGHIDVISRARRMFDRIVVGVGENPNKQHMLTPKDRLSLMQNIVADLPGADGAPVEVQAYGGLTVDFARAVGASALLRGIRNVTDLASECQLAIANRQVANIESAFIITDERYGFTSSSLIRQIVELGGDIQKLSNIVPAAVLEHLKQHG
jgi:pantetheine-phosphate adenylyltransferase